MEQAAARLADAEESASEHQRRAVRDPSSAHKSAIYPPGSEYALCHAETQLMSAVIAVLNESLTESLRGFYKLRKAFVTLQEIFEAERRYLAKHKSSTNPSSAASGENLPTGYETRETSGTNSGVLTPVNGNDTSNDSDNDLGFADAEESVSDKPATGEYQGHLEMPTLSKLNVKDEEDLGLSPSPPTTTTSSNAAPNPTRSKTFDDDLDFASVTSDPIDLFIHSGTALCFGLLQLILSLVPPAFSRLLSILSFHGDREQGLRLLWKATAFKDNVNGGLAGLITLGFHNAAVAVCDIHAREAYPKERIRSLLQDMRSLYPDSCMWILEEARMANAERDLERAISILKGNSVTSPLRQVEALRVFELSLTLLYLHRYEECANSFLKCIELNNWSHGMYYYNAGCCFIELYRQHRDSEPETAAKFQTKAKELLLNQVPAHVGKKRFMARQLPLDVFISRKIEKWTQRSKARNCDFVDAVGVSPMEEMIYFWSGFKRMSEQQLLESLDRLAWSENHDAYWKDEVADEKAVHGALKATCLRNLDRVEEAMTVLEQTVFCYDLYQVKACDQADNWPLPVAHYEAAACHWQEAGGQDGDRKVLQKCSDSLLKVERWEGFDMDARIGLKLTTARETLRRIGISSG